eukprot:1157657-Pelagomonas_calceolata.AAC.3
MSAVIPLSSETFDRVFTQSSGKFKINFLARVSILQSTKNFPVRCFQWTSGRDVSFWLMKALRHVYDGD